MLEFQNSTKQELDGIISRCSADIALLHSSRATPALVEDIPVMVYGQRSALKQIASLSTPDAHTILVQPWDPSALPEIQKAIEQSHLGMGIAPDERYIRLSMPELSEERRKEVVRTLGKKVEEARIGIRRARDHTQKSIEEAFRAKEISEDEKFRSKTALQKIIDEGTHRLDALEEQKTRDILGK